MGGPIGRDFSLLDPRLKDSADLFDEVQKDKTISDVTKGELAKLIPDVDIINKRDKFDDELKKFLDNKDGVDQARSILEDARAGVKSKFKLRQLAQNSAELTADRPGLLQTRGGKR